MNDLYSWLLEHFKRTLNIREWSIEPKRRPKSNRLSNFLMLSVTSKFCECFESQKKFRYQQWPLTYLISLVSFYTRWKHQKTSGVLVFSVVREREQRTMAWNGLKTFITLILGFDKIFDFESIEHFMYTVRTFWN